MLALGFACFHNTRSMSFSLQSYIEFQWNRFVQMGILQSIRILYVYDRTMGVPIESSGNFGCDYRAFH